MPDLSAHSVVGALLGHRGTHATGGNSYWQGTGNPVSFQPYFTDLRRRLNHQYAAGIATELRGKPDVKDLKLELHVPSAKVDAPEWVFVN